MNEFEDLTFVRKTIPKKVKGISVSYESKVGNCPRCFCLVREIDNPSFCPKCQQKLDWKE